MDQFSEEFWQTLKKLIRLWRDERGMYNELQLNTENIVFEGPDRIDCIGYHELEQTIVERYLQDLALPARLPYKKLTYVVDDEDQRLSLITQGIKCSSFRNQPVNSRLQYFYHLGEVLTLRG